MVNGLIRSSSLSNKFSLSVALFRRCLAADSKVADKNNKVLMNKMIPHDPIRVNFVDKEGEKKSEIMSKQAALLIAKEYKMDLVLGKAFNL